MLSMLFRACQSAAAILLIVLSLVSAQEAPCGGDVTISDVTDLTKLSGCPTWTGSITIHSITTASTALSIPLRPTSIIKASQTVPPDSFPTIPPGLVVDGLELISDGSLDISNLAAESDSGFSINFPSLREVDGDLSLSRIDELGFMYFPALTRIGSSIALEDLTFINALASSLKVQLPALTAVWNISVINTGVTSIGNWELGLSTDMDYPVTHITVTDNPSLEDVTLAGYMLVPLDIDIRNNNNDVRVNFSDVQNASLHLNQVSSFIAPDLATLWQSPKDPNDPLTISNSDISILQLPGLTQVQGYLQIADNPSLEVLDISGLQAVTGLEIDENNKLHTINLPDLTAIGDSVTIKGTINALELPQAQRISGDVDITTDGTLQCDSLPELPQDQGSIDCTTTSSISSATAEATANASGSPDNSQSSSSGGLSTGAKAGIGVGVGLGVLLILAAIAFCCLRSRRRRSTKGSRGAAVGEYSKSQQAGYGNGESPVSPVGYSKVPYESSHAEDMQEQQGDRRPPSSLIGDDWTPPGQSVPTTDGRVELEEQQGPRHEMDARSLPDIDMDDEEEETRSLQDIEAAHSRDVRS